MLLPSRVCCHYCGSFLVDSGFHLVYVNQRGNLCFFIESLTPSLVGDDRNKLSALGTLGRGMEIYLAMNMLGRVCTTAVCGVYTDVFTHLKVSISLCGKQTSSLGCNSQRGLHLQPVLEACTTRAFIHIVTENQR